MQSIKEPLSLLVLVVDDDIPTGMWLSRQIKAYGHRVWNATNGTEALSLSEQFTFDIVVTDCRMVGINGFEVARELRRRIAGRDLAIIGMTASAHSSDLQYGQEVGMDMCVIKPLSKEKIRKIFSVQTRAEFFCSIVKRGHLFLPAISIIKNKTYKCTDVSSSKTYMAQYESWKKYLEVKKSLTSKQKHQDLRKTVPTINYARVMKHTHQMLISQVFQASREMFLKQMQQREFLLTVRAHNLNDLQALERAVAAQNHREVAHIAHKVRGIASIMGYVEIVQIAEHLEAISLLPSPKIQQLKKCIAQMCLSLKAFNREIAKQLQKSAII